MEKLNNYLQQLLNTSGYELHLEPNKNPYIMTAKGHVDAAPTPLPGSQINSMIFSLIPNDVKQQLPNQPEIDFEHPHVLGRFAFNVKKSPAGFNVTITLSSKKGLSSKDDVEPQSSFENSVAPDAPAPKIEAEREDKAPESVVEPQATVGSFGDGVEPDEYPGSENAYQTTYESSAAQIDVDSYGSQYEIEYTDSDQDGYSDEPNAGFASEPIAEATIETVSYNPEPVPHNSEMIQNPSTSTVYDAPVSTTVAAQSNNFTPASPQKRAEMDALFAKMAEVGASDLHLSVSMPPLIRKDGKMAELVPNAQKLNQESMRVLLHSIMPDANKEEFEERNDTDFAYEIPGLARFRANVFRDRKGMGGVFRIIPTDILTAEDLGLSKAIMNLTELSKGLVVVTGPTGSGKSTTLCAMVDSINKTRQDHIITIEDPIEFTHENQKCLVNQREVHNHTKSFKDALRAALREDPDILLVGEMRDLETISIAIETAETGHLVFGTLHTTTAPSTVDRIIDQFPADRQQQIRVMLSESLKGVIAQTLLPKIGGGRVAALEVLIVTPAIANLIREGKTFQIPSAMQTGKNLGMTMLNDSLMDLVNKGLVEPKDAYIKAVDKTGFEMLLQRAGKRI